jgi:acyl-CoA synthetase (AMP-forming)/AMP-acid ligase II
VSELTEIESLLTRPGGPFEIQPDAVLGVEIPVFKNRKPSLRTLLEESIQHGEKEYIVYEDRRITYADHARLVASVARALQELHGVGKGDRVAIVAANCPEWILAFWATVSLGAIAVGLNGWWTGDEIEFGVRNSEPKVLIGDRKRLERVRGVELGVPVLEIESEFETLSRFDPGAGLPAVPIAEDDPACILYTSGTTGRPKGAVNSHRNVVGFCSINMFHGVRSMMLAAKQGLAPPSPVRPTCSLVTTPLFHVSGLFAGAVMMLQVGAKTVWRRGRFDPVDVMRLIERERVTTWGPMGAMVYRVVHHPEVGRYDLSSVVNVGSGGAPMSAELQNDIRSTFEKARRSVALGYGLTESGALATLNPGEELEKHSDSAGRPLPTVALEIRDAEGKVLPEGDEGEIFIRSPLVMLEYWRDPEATAEVIRPGRWLATGDIGRIEEGRLYVDSRARDLILRGSENIYPAEIEQRVEAHPSVAECAVVGVEHEELGQEVKAIVVPAPGRTVDLDELRRFVAETLAPFKVPAHWVLSTEPLPRNAAGKVLKHVLVGAAENPFVEE